MIARHYGMDWLRVGAFALLILYHVGMVFVPWNFHINLLPPVRWATWPMLAINPWRLTLLFVVSGYASRALLAKGTGSGRFAWQRTLRLLVPLLFGMAVIVPPQPWVELTVKAGLTTGYWPFWFHDYFDFKRVAGVDLPTWNHLWFVAYLWVYTLLLAVAIAAVGRFGAQLQRAYDRVFGGWGGLVWPTLWFAAVHGWWFVMAPETHALFGDWVAHFTYLPAFLFGFGLAGSARALAAFRRHWRSGLAVGLIGYAGVLAVEFSWPGNTPAPRWVYTPYGIVHAVQQWGVIAALIGIADTYWNRDHRWRRTLTEAVFPFYIIHQTVIVLVAYWLLPVGLPRWADFVVLVAATIAGCWAFYLGGRSIRWLRPLIGLRLTSAASRT